MTITLSYWYVGSPSDTRLSDPPAIEAGGWLANSAGHPDIIGLGGISDDGVGEVMSLLGCDAYDVYCDPQSQAAILVKRGWLQEVWSQDECVIAALEVNSRTGYVAIFNQAPGGSIGMGLSAVSNGAVCLGGFGYDLDKDDEGLASNCAIQLRTGMTGLGPIRQTRRTGGLHDFAMAPADTPIKSLLSAGALSTWKPTKTAGWPVCFAIG